MVSLESLSVIEPRTGRGAARALTPKSTRGPLLAVLLAAFPPCTSLADSLVVTRDGNGVWASATRVDGDTLLYTVGTGRVERSVAQSNVVAVIPGVEKGKTYTPQDVDGATNMVVQIERRFPRLFRYTNALRQEWNTVRNPETTPDARIDEILSAFAAKRKTPAAFKDCCYRVEMLRYRDKQGLLTAKLDAATDRLRADFFRAAQADLASLVAAAPPSLTNYAVARNFADLVLSCQLTDKQRPQIEEPVRKYFVTTVDALVSPSINALATDRSIDHSLAARARLSELRRAAAGAKEAQASIAGWEARLIESTTNALPEYDLTSSGFPLNAEDRLLMAGTGGVAAACATGAVYGMVLDEQCLLLVTQAVQSVAAGDRIPLPLRFIFGYSQPRDRRFAIAGVLKTGSATPSPSMWRLPDLAIRDGRAEMKITLTAPVRQTAQAAKAPSVFYLFLVCESPAPASALSNASWTAISRSLAIPIR